MTGARWRLAGFAVMLAALFGGGLLAGGLIDPDAYGDDAPAPHAEADAGHGAEADAGRGAEAEAGHADEGGHAAPTPVRGLAVADGGLRLVLDEPELRRARTERLRFRIVGEHDATVRDFDVEHEERMHVIVARRDLTGFQHLHPRQAADGSWVTSVRLAAAGSYRLFADFSHEGEARTLATDLRVDGRATLRPLAAPRAIDRAGGYAVRVDAGDPHAGEEAELRFTITRDGTPVRPEPYLGAGGHLVALRDGDLAFLHVHPVAHGDDGVAFAATFPTAGRYRLFLQFKHEGRVRTVAYTQEVTA